MRDKPRLIAIASLSLALLLPSLAPAGEVKERDMRELYTLAKGKDPGINRAEAALDSGRADKEIARAALLPKISANGSVREFWHKVLYYSSPMEGQYTGFSYGAGGTLPILNVPAYRQLSVADAGIDSAEAGIIQARQDLIKRLAQAYIALLKAKADEKLYQDEVCRVRKILEQAEAFLKEGTGDIIAVYEAKARVDNAAAELIKTEGQLRLAQQNLSILSGVDVASVRDVPIENSHGPQPADIQWWIDTMLQRHPALVKSRLDLLQAEESVRAVSANHYPTIDGNGGYTVDKGSTFLPKVETRQWYAGLRLNFPIYSGGDTVARTRRAVAAESETRAQRDEAQENAIRKLKEAYVTLEYSDSLVAAYRQKHESALVQLKATRKGREIGTRTAIDLLNAEQSYAVSRRDLCASLYDNLLRQIELKAAAGIVSESDLAAFGAPEEK